MAGPPSPVAFPRQAETDEHLIRLWLHGRPANTQRAYSRDAEQFRAFVRKALGQVTVGDIQAFADDLSGLSDTSRARLLSSVKSLLTYGHRIGYLPFNVGAPVHLPRVKDTIAERILPEETVLKMIAFESHPRNKAVIRLLYSAGLLVSELSGLDWKDFQERDEAAQVTVFGKGGKTRHILLTAGTWEGLCSIRDDAGADDPGFISRKGSRLSTSQVLRIVRKAAERAGVDLMVSPALATALSRLPRPRQGCSGPSRPGHAGTRLGGHHGTVSSCPADGEQFEVSRCVNLELPRQIKSIFTATGHIARSRPSRSCGSRVLIPASLHSS